MNYLTAAQAYAEWRKLGGYEYARTESLIDRMRRNGIGKMLTFGGATKWGVTKDDVKQMYMLHGKTQREANEQQARPHHLRSTAKLRSAASRNR
jgi:hypothetical protein